MKNERLMTDEEICGESCTHPENIENARRNMPEERTLTDVSELFKVLGDGTRLKILFVLLSNEMCVCDLSEMLGMTLSAVSHQLRVLRQARLVRFRREGKTVFYALADDHVRTLLSQGLDHVGEERI